MHHVCQVGIARLISTAQICKYYSYASTVGCLERPTNNRTVTTVVDKLPTCVQQFQLSVTILLVVARKALSVPVRVIACKDSSLKRVELDSLTHALTAD